jgi:Cu(I)-responsive transcriptional regulator
MNIGAAAQHSGLPVKTVRYYADIGLVAAEGRSASQYRVYGEREIRKLVFIRRAREFGFSVAECRELLDLYENANRSSADVKRLAVEKIDDIRRKMDELQRLHDELAHLAATCNGDERPDCPILKSFASGD